LLEASCYNDEIEENEDSSLNNEKNTDINHNKNNFNKSDSDQYINSKVKSEMKISNSSSGSPLFLFSTRNYISSNKSSTPSHSSASSVSSLTDNVVSSNCNKAFKHSIDFILGRLDASKQNNKRKGRDLLDNDALSSNNSSSGCSEENESIETSFNKKSKK
jgi:hypothetical protein